MLRRIRIALSAALPLVVVAAGLFGQPALATAPTTYTYPSGACPLSSTGLQDCIDNATSGDEVEVAIQTVAEYVTVNKSLNVTAASGFAPTLIGMLIEGSSGQIQVSVSDLAFTFQVRVLFDGGANHAVSLDRLHIDSTTDTALALDSLEPGDIVVTNSDIQASGSSASAVYVVMSGDGSTVAMIGNHITAHGKGPNTGGGVTLAFSNSGENRVDLYNNTIWDVAKCFCGAESGLAILADDTSKSVINAVGNTIEKVGSDAVQLRNGLQSGGHVTLNLYNSILSHSAQRGLHLDSSLGNTSRITLNADYNDFYGNARKNFLEGHSMGSHNKTVSPRFVNAASGNLRLKSTSGLINKGIVCSPGGLAISDAAGNNRLKGKSVDIGAYERGAAAPTGIALVGTDGADSLSGSAGDDILCGLGGGDLLSSGEGADYLDGGPGADGLIGGPGPDRLYGGSDGDYLCLKDGVKGNDKADGGSGTDTYVKDKYDVVSNMEVKLSACS